MKSSKSRASGTGSFVVADEGRAKASLHHDSQSNEGAGSGKGSETICFLGAQSEPRGFLAGVSSEFDSEKRLLRERGGEETVWEGVGGRESRWEDRSGEGALNCTKRYLMSRRTGHGTHRRRLRRGDRTGWGSGGSSEQDRFRFREGLEASSSLSSESVECVSEGVADWLRDRGD